MTTSTHIGGFWFHITWLGDYGIDHRGNKWENRSNPQPVDKVLKSMCQMAHSLIVNSVK